MTSTSLYSVRGQDGKELDSHFAIELIEGRATLVYESRGGARGAENERNSDYAPGLTVSLSRLGNLGLSIEDAVVDSHATQRMGLTHQDRRIVDSKLTYPIDVNSYEDVEELRKLLCSAQRPIGRLPDSLGKGDNTRRIRLFLQANTLELDELTRYLAGWVNPVLNTQVEFDSARSESAASGAFDPTSITDARKKTIGAIVLRQGQPTFRKNLLAAYDSKCAVTGCEVIAVLEAAHVHPYQGSLTNDVRNGILLRSDIHTLFDCGLITIDTTVDPWLVLVDASLNGSDYAPLHGRPIRLPKRAEDRPCKTAIDMHRCRAGL